MVNLFRLKTVKVFLALIALVLFSSTVFADDNNPSVKLMSDPKATVVNGVEYIYADIGDIIDFSFEVEDLNYYNTGYSWADSSGYTNLYCETYQTPENIRCTVVDAGETYVVATAYPTNSSYTETYYDQKVTSNKIYVKVEGSSTDKSVLKIQGVNFYEQKNDKNDVLVVNVCNEGDNDYTAWEYFDVYIGEYKDSMAFDKDIDADDCIDFEVEDLLSTWYGFSDLEGGNHDVKVVLSDQGGNYADPFYTEIYIDGDQVNNATETTLEVKAVDFYQEKNGKKDLLIVNVCNNGDKDYNGGEYFQIFIDNEEDNMYFDEDIEAKDCMDFEFENIFNNLYAYTEVERGNNDIKIILMDKNGYKSKTYDDEINTGASTNTAEESVGNIDLEDVLYEEGYGYHDYYAAPLSEWPSEDDNVLKNIGHGMYTADYQNISDSLGIAIWEYSSSNYADDDFWSTKKNRMTDNGARYLEDLDIGDDSYCYLAQKYSYSEAEDMFVLSFDCSFVYKNVMMRISSSIIENNSYSSSKIDNFITEFANIYLGNFETRLYGLEKNQKTDSGIASGSSQGSSGTPVNSSQIMVPPAGYEDEVLTNPETYKNPFSDTDINTLEGKAAAELYRRAVIGGFSDGEFKGERNVNRAEAAKFLLLARFGSVSDSQNNGRFMDIIDGEWYVKYVMQAYYEGIISGYGDGTFKPQDNVNVAEFLKMLTLTFDLEENLSYSYKDVKATDWFSKYVGIAEKYDLFVDRESMLSPDEDLTRSEVAIAIYEFLLNR